MYNVQCTVLYHLIQMIKTERRNITFVYTEEGEGEGVEVEVEEVLVSTY